MTGFDAGGDIGDGRYDVFVIDAVEVDTDPDVDRMQVSLTILAGEQKGQVVELTAQGLGRSEVDLIGMPGTLVVTDGAPSLTIDD
ncbi:MAG: hypothetical protein JJE52_02625 [Acidimicrobiia bacterium]|nr:hypothetical protein [Acidimicrobiia bacterium]